MVGASCLAGSGLEHVLEEEGGPPFLLNAGGLGSLRAGSG